MSFGRQKIPELFGKDGWASTKMDYRTAALVARNDIDFDSVTSVPDGPSRKEVKRQIKDLRSNRKELEGRIATLRQVIADHKATKNRRLQRQAEQNLSTVQGQIRTINTRLKRLGG